MVTRNCKYCKKEFKTYKAWLRKGNAGFYCSKNCLSLSKTSYIIKLCIFCHNEFNIIESRKDIRKYCSRECYYVGKNFFTEKKEYKRKIKQSSIKRTNYDKNWSNSIILRDRKCLKCGKTNNLHAHHIKPRRIYPELSLDLNNGIALCDLCHAKEHPELPEAFIRQQIKTRKIRKCDNCNNEYLAKYKSSMFCSNKCKFESKVQTKIKRNCSICFKEFERYKRYENISTCCSLKCAGELGRRNRKFKNISLNV